MSILIRGVDPKRYAKFKARAAEEGLKISEALERAMAEWIEHQEQVRTSDAERQTNLTALRRLRSTLEAEHPDSWVVIAKGDLQFVGSSLEELREFLREHPIASEQAFVFQIGKPFQPRTMSIGRRGFT